jgi:predicted DsbA family dithiol-disulfide isomerase
MSGAQLLRNHKS